jgi:hypothetical protein
MEAALAVADIRNISVVHSEPPEKPNYDYVCAWCGRRLTHADFFPPGGRRAGSCYCSPERRTLDLGDDLRNSAPDAVINCFELVERLLG